MTRLRTRRAALRSGVAIALAAVSAGCGDDDEGTAATPDAATTQTETDEDPSVEGDAAARVDGDAVPGVEGGTVVSARDLSIAHDETLRRRSGRIVQSSTETNRELGESVRTGVRHVGIDGERALSVAVGDHLPEAVERREVYADGNDIYQRTSIDGEWDAERIEPGSGFVRAANLTGRSYLESSLHDARVVGPDPGIDGQYVLRRSSRSRESEADDRNGREAEWFRVHATVDEHGLCHEWGEVADEKRGDVPWRYSLEARVDGFLETTVTRPGWVADLGT